MGIYTIKKTCNKHNHIIGSENDLGLLYHVWDHLGQFGTQHSL